MKGRKMERMMAQTKPVLFRVVSSTLVVPAFLQKGQALTYLGTRELHFFGQWVDDLR